MAFEEQGGGTMSNINVTPLVDVMLVLLVIFMVTAPILQQGVNINLPKVKSTALTGEEQQPSWRSIGAARSSNDAAIPLPDLGPKLQAISGAPDRQVFLRPTRASGTARPRRSSPQSKRGR
jgi:biopolymer transport protein TolR